MIPTQIEQERTEEGELEEIAEKQEISKIIKQKTETKEHHRSYLSRILKEIKELVSDPVNYILNKIVPHVPYE